MLLKGSMKELGEQLRHGMETLETRWQSFLHTFSSPMVVGSEPGSAASSSDGESSGSSPPPADPSDAQ